MDSLNNALDTHNWSLVQKVYLITSKFFSSTYKAITFNRVQKHFQTRSCIRQGNVAHNLGDDNLSSLPTMVVEVFHTMSRLSKQSFHRTFLAGNVHNSSKSSKLTIDKIYASSKKVTG